MRYLRKVIDFCLTLLYFPQILSLVRFLKLASPTSIAERAFLYIAAEEIAVSGDILEIGSLRGASSIILSAGNQRSKNKGIIYLVEPVPLPSRNDFMNIFNAGGLSENIKLIEATSAQAKTQIYAKFRFIFIDGNHDYAFVKDDILLWQDRLNDGGIVAFHDIFNDNVRQAVDEYIYKSEKFTVLGKIGSILFASRGKCVNNALVSRFNRLNATRETLRTLFRKWS